ncbi:MAG: hypothetical protein KAT00_03690 [Planctomycetes bacterium]|nr:hypothetical protein [Planctomycetota bacterium]
MKKTQILASKSPWHPQIKMPAGGKAGGVFQLKAGGYTDAHREIMG